MRYFKNYPKKINQTWQAQIMVNTHCATTQMQKSQSASPSNWLSWGTDQSTPVRLVI